MIRLGELLKGKGWDIRFVFDDVDTSGENPLGMTDYLTKQLSEGKTLADGYIIRAYTGCADEMLKSGYAKDLSKLIPAIVPVYYSMYKNLLSGKITGLPLDFIEGYGSTALMLKKRFVDKSGADIKTIDDMFALLKSGAGPVQIITVDFRPILNAWAFEKGFYPLDEFYMQGYLFAEYGDKDCTPVPLEDIPGFRGFAEEFRYLLENQRLLLNVNNGEGLDGDTYIGYIGSLESFHFPYNLFMQEQSVAFPLMPGTMNSSFDNLSNAEELVVSASSSKANDILHFVEWMSTRQENYDLMNYGEPGIDYRLSDDRYEPLISGKPLPAEQWNAAASHQSFFVIGSSPFYNAMFARDTTSASSNIVTARHAFDAFVPALLNIDGFKQRENYRGKMLSLDTDLVFSNQIAARQNGITQIFNSEINADGYDLDELFNQLLLINNKMIVSKYKDIINNIKSSN